MNRHWIATPWVVLLVVSQAACTPDTTPDLTKTTTGEKVDAAIEQTQEAASSSAMALSDTAITTRVKTRLATDKELESMDIQVQTQEGRVILRGTAPSASAQLRAKELASSVEGAHAVDNLLTIKQP